MNEEDNTGRKERPLSSAWTELQNAGFDVGEQDKLQGLKEKYENEPKEQGEQAFEDDWNEELRQIRVRIGTLLKTDTVSFLLGAGISKDCGGVLLSSVPREIETRLLEHGITGDPERVEPWLLLLYHAITAQGFEGAPTTEDEVLARRDKGDDAQPLSINYENVISQLYYWRSALINGGSIISETAGIRIEVSADDLDTCLKFATDELAKAVRLPLPEKLKELATFKKFMRKILTRPLNLKRVNLFTLNYDTLLEQASDAEGVVLIDGFVGILNRIFRPECYDQDLYFPAQTTEGRVHRYDRVVHLYKLHGSITWFFEEPTIDNPYGVISCDSDLKEIRRLIYPTPAKYGETLGMPYAELFRRFASNVARPQSTLFVIGYGFGDDHVNAIIRQALAVPSFTLVIVSPTANSEFIEILRAQNDSRVWILSGSTLGTFRGFVKKALPDLREEGVEEKVQSTFKALGIKQTLQGVDEDE